MKAHNIKSPTHRVHSDILPVISAIKKGNKRIANLRFSSLCQKMNLMKWESSVIAELIRNTCVAQQIKLL
jgi:hypothetical protein